MSNKIKGMKHNLTGKYYRRVQTEIFKKIDCDPRKMFIHNDLLIFEGYFFPGAIAFNQKRINNNLQEYDN